MWEPVLPLGGRALLTGADGEYAFRRVVVDRVDAEDGPYDVLHLGTGEVVQDGAPRQTYRTNRTKWQLH